MPPRKKAAAVAAPSAPAGQVDDPAISAGSGRGRAMPKEVADKDASSVEDATSYPKPATKRKSEGSSEVPNKRKKATKKEAGAAAESSKPIKQPVAEEAGSMKPPQKKAEPAISEKPETVGSVKQTTETVTGADKAADPIKKDAPSVKMSQSATTQVTKRKAPEVGYEPSTKKVKTTAAKGHGMKTENMKSKPQITTKNGTSKAKKVPAPKSKKSLPMLNSPPTQILDVYVFGEGSGGELGLGAIGSKNHPVIDVTQPRLNRYLGAETAGVVQVAVGSVHCVALTNDNRILTWGLNDQGALGRETLDQRKEQDGDDISVFDEQSAAESETSGGSPNAKISKKRESSSPKKEDQYNASTASAEAKWRKEKLAKLLSHDPNDDPVDSGLNPHEAEPGEVDMEDVPEGTIFASVYATDNTSFAVTTDGKVFGWGSFRGNDSVLGFRPGINIQRTPMLIPELKNIKTIACGANHALALDTKGKAFTWGAGEQNQLARRVVSRTAAGALIPREFGLGKKKIAKISCGDFHSFAMTDKGEVYAWGSNTFGQTGVKKGDAGTEEEDTVLKPTLADAFVGSNIEQIVGGAHHSVACTKEGKILVIGRIDGAQAGTDLDKIPEETIHFDEHDRERYLTKPVCHAAKTKIAFVATGADTSLALSSSENDKGGSIAYTWGFSSCYQTGQGSDEDVVEITPLVNDAVRGKTLIGGGIGAQFGVLLAVHEPPEEHTKRQAQPAR